MGLGNLLGRLRAPRASTSGRNAATSEPPFRRQRAVFEQLEDRMLLSVTGVFDGTLFLTAGADVNASVLGGSQTETHIAINPTQAGNLVVMSNGGAATNEFTATSADAGANWTAVGVGNTQDGLGATGSRFDGAAAVDDFGNVHIVYMARPTTNANPMGIIHAMSSDGGQTYTVVNVLANAVGVDKPWIAVGPDSANPANQVVYVTHKDGANNIVAYGATVTGLGTMGAFSAAATVSDVAGGNYAVPTVGPNGELVVTWTRPSGGEGPVSIFVDRDLDGLANGLAFGGDITATTSNAGGFDFIPATPDRSAFSSPYVAYDRSGGTFDGRMYLVYADEPTDENNDFDIFLRFSTDDGATWSAPVQVNPGDGATGNSQFFQAISVDQSTGALFISWYDARNDLNDGSAGDIDTDNAANSEVEYFATASLDGGATFLAPVRVSDGSSDEDRADPNNNDFGDYTGIAAFAGSAFATWADNSNSTGDNPGGNTTFDVYVDRVVLNSTGGQILTATGGAGNDVYILRLDASGTFLEMWENDPSLSGLPDFVGTFAAINRVAVNPDGGADTFIVDFLNGNPIPTGGIDFDGGTGSDLLELRNGTLASVAYFATGVGSGRVTADGRTIRYLGLEPILDTTSAAARSFTSEIPGAQTIVIHDDGIANGLSRIDDGGTAAFEQVTFANPTTSLTVNAGDGADVIRLLALDSAFTAAVVVNAGDDGDTVLVQAAPSGGASVNAGAGSDAITVDFGALAGAVTVDGASESDTLLVNGTAGADVLDLAAASVSRGGSETVSFVGVEDLTVDAGDGADQITVNNTGPITAVLGGLGEDDFFVKAVAVAGITLNGQGDSDDYTVNFGALLGAVNVADSPVGEFDRLFVNGTSGDDVLLIAPAFVKRGSDETVNYSGIEELNVDAGDGNDDIAVDGTSVPTTVLGGLGDDDFTVNGPMGAPLTLNGGPGTDSLLFNGTPGDDVIILTDSTITGLGANITFISIENLVVDAGAGNDLVDGSALTMSVTIYGGTGDDTLIGGSNNDKLYGQDDNDDLIGNLGNDYLDGGKGSDGLVGDKGTIAREVLDGSTATTLAIPSGKLSATINEAGIRRNVTLIDAEQGGDDELVGGEGDDYLHGGAGNDKLDGNEGADALFGDAGNDTVAGGTGDDHLYGGAGNDTLDGQQGADIAYGGDGDDRLVADQSGDRLIDWFGNFNDFVVPGPGYGSPTIVRSPSPWVQDFVLRLAFDDGASDPNAEIRVVIPGSSLQQSNSGPGGRT